MVIIYENRKWRRVKTVLIENNEYSNENIENYSENMVKEKKAKTRLIFF